MNLIVFGSVVIGLGIKYRLKFKSWRSDGLRDPGSHESIWCFEKVYGGSANPKSAPMDFLYQGMRALSRA